MVSCRVLWGWILDVLLYGEGEFKTIIERDLWNQKVFQENNFEGDSKRRCQDPNFRNASDFALKSSTRKKINQFVIISKNKKK